MLIDNWKKQINDLGIISGDTVLVVSSLKAISDEMKGKCIAEAFISTLVDIVGESGTIIGLSFSHKFFMIRKKRDVIFHNSCKAITGGFVNAMLAWPAAIRSKHPTNSFVAVGANANYLLDDHGPESYCFYPIKKLLTLGGKILIVGCVYENPGFSTVHLIQYELGLSNKSLLSNKIGAYYYNDEKQLCLFKKPDIPGCSKGFNKFYPYYEEQGKLRKGYIGEAYSYCINAKDAYDIEYELIKDNPRFALCDNNDCIICRGTWYYNFKEWPKFYFNRNRFRHMLCQLSTDKRLPKEQVDEIMLKHKRME